MGIRVFDPEEPAGYACTCTHSNTNTSANCANSGNNSNSSNSNASNGSCSSASNCSNSNSSTCSSRNIDSRCICSHKPAVPTLTLTFANNSSYDGIARNYHFSETETLQTQPNATPINAATTTATTSTHITNKDLVGNCKEYRMENNTCDLRIIGNSNRIRIGCNMGNLQIIGNSTRLKITNNSGKIRYTGNEGRICLGSDSTQQIVDYIGNNGKLKVVKAAELLSEKCKNHKQKIPLETEGDEVTDRQDTTTTTPLAGTEQKYAGTSFKTTAKSASATTTTTKTVFPACTKQRKAKVKSASFAGDHSAKWQQFNKLFERHSCRRNCDTSSMPNLKNEVELEDGFGVIENAQKHTINGDASKISGKSCKIENNINIVNTYGNISIKNAVNVSI